MERARIPEKTMENNPHGQRSAAGIYEPPRGAPAKVAVREPSGPIQSVIMRRTLRCARALQR
eukprot:1579464-Pyramimonas_sp.AAC.1